MGVTRRTSCYAWLRIPVLLLLCLPRDSDIDGFLHPECNRIVNKLVVPSQLSPSALLANAVPIVRTCSRMFALSQLHYSSLLAYRYAAHTHKCHSTVPHGLVHTYTAPRCFFSEMGSLRRSIEIGPGQGRQCHARRIFRSRTGRWYRQSDSSRADQDEIQGSGDPLHLLLLHHQRKFRCGQRGLGR